MREKLFCNNCLKQRTYSLIIRLNQTTIIEPSVKGSKLQTHGESPKAEIVCKTCGSANLVMSGYEKLMVEMMGYTLLLESIKNHIKHRGLQEIKSDDRTDV